MRRTVLVLAAGSAAIVPGMKVVATLPPDGESGVDIVRAQAEAAAAEYFTTTVGEGVSHVVCETPSADSAGIVFYCYGVTSGGAPVVSQATINDYGTAELAAVAASATATTAAPTTTSPVVSSAEGTGSQVVQVDPISGPTIVGVTHAGDGPFSVQPQQGGVPAGPAFATVEGPWSGRYLVGLGGTISGFAVTADGDWTLAVEQRNGALTFDPTAGVTGENPDVVAYENAAPWTATVAVDGAGPIVVSAVTLAGAQPLVDQTGPFTGTVEIPAGPGFVTVDAAGSWSLQPVADG
ncbi:MAG TPA: hypothetical protein VFP09_01530 [Desertimonas sp.]|nr:hypothetical protein [Desertimonas sp.]